MAWDDLVRVKLEDGSETSVGRSFAEAHGYKPLTDENGDELAATSNGITIEPVYPADAFTVDLTGKELNTALEDAGLPTSGKLAEKQRRLAEHLASQAGGDGESSDSADVE